MKTNESHKLGMNRTGISVSPVDSKELISGAEELTVPPEGSAEDFAENRIRYMKEAERVGSVPMPTTLKGALSGLKENMKYGTHVLIDKLGERLAFERSGTRLYDALISKHRGEADQSKLPPLDLLIRYREEERSHFMLVSKVISDLGADPTAMTPAADIVGVASLGLIQVITDPRTTFAQCLDAILIAELADNDGWDLLVSLTEEGGMKEIADQFRVARNAEAIHLASIREWLMNLNVGKAAAEGVSPGLKTRAGAEPARDTDIGEDRLQSQ